MRLLFTLLFFLSIHQTAFAQLSMVDSISWLIDSTKNESYEFQHASSQRALILAKNAQLLRPEAKALIRLGTTQSYMGNHTKALENFNKAEILIEENNYPRLKSLLYLKKSGVLARLEHYDENIAYNEEAVKWFIKQKDTINLGFSYGNIGAMYYAKRQNDDAVSYLEKGLLTLEGTESENDGMLLSNLAGVYLANNQADRAIPIFKSYLKETRRTNSKIHEVGMLINLGYAYGMIENYQKSFDYYENALKLADEGNFLDAKYQTFQKMSYTYQLKGDYKKALQYYEDYRDAKDKVIGKKTQDEITELKIKYDTFAKERELNSLQQETKIKTQKFLLFIAILFAFIIIGILAYLKRASDFKKNKALHATEQKLMQTKLENKELEEKRLQERLDYQNKDLTNLALDITRKNEFSNQLLLKINTLDHQVPIAVKGELNSIKLFVSNNLRINEELEVFQKSIEEINQDFYQQLLKHFPNLTAKDTELCGLIRLNRSNKEIAALKNISVSSAKMSRYRLRKKLNLQSEDDIVNFLRDFK